MLRQPVRLLSQAPNPNSTLHRALTAAEAAEAAVAEEVGAVAEEEVVAAAVAADASHI